jgi:hypothetical protein
LRGSFGEGEGPHPRCAARPPGQAINIRLIGGDLRVAMSRTIVRRGGAKGMPRNAA